VLYAMFSAYSADSVVKTCERGGIPVERLSSDVLVGSASGGLPDASHATG